MLKTHTIKRRNESFFMDCRLNTELYAKLNTIDNFSHQGTFQRLLGKFKNPFCNVTKSTLKYMQIFYDESKVV